MRPQEKHPITITCLRQDCPFKLTGREWPMDDYPEIGENCSALQLGVLEHHRQTSISSRGHDLFSISTPSIPNIQIEVHGNHVTRTGIYSFINGTGDQDVINFEQEVRQLVQKPYSPQLFSARK